jgi:adenylate cyclase
MATYRRIVLDDALLAIGLLTGGWYLYYLVSIGSFLDYFREGPMLDYITGPGIHVEMLVSGLGLGLIMALVNHFTEGTRIRTLPFGTVILLKSGVYVVALVALGILVNLLFWAFLFTAEELQALWTLFNPRLIGGLALWILFSIIGVNFLLEVRRKVGPGNLWALLTGRYHTPREEERVFLFVDLEDSTGIAERLGHSRYSQFLRQCFHDLTDFVILFGGQIYQYVGDEVVLTWPAGSRDATRRALDTFFSFQKRLAEKGAWYESTFGAVPIFKCGMEEGRVTATEVGDIKRDIAFHGDPLNTAARLMSLCREYEQAVLISGKVQRAIAGDTSLSTLLKGEVTLRGKSEPVSVFGVSPARAGAA